MYTLYDALTADSSTQGIKGIDVFFDTLFINLKTNNPYNNKRIDYVLIEKLLFNYDTGEITSDKNYTICFGNTTYSSPYFSDGNKFVDNILIDSKKTVLVCGLSTCDATLTASIGTETISGGALFPIVYEYDINTSDLKKIYPKTSTDILNWSNFLIGDYIYNQTPIVFYNKEFDKLNYIFKTDIYAATKNIHTLNQITFDYNSGLIVTNVRQMTSLSANNNFVNYDLRKGAYIDSDEVVLISTKSNISQIFNLQ